MVDSRIREFEAAGRSRAQTFSELCFCLLTANYSAGRAIAIQRIIGGGFLNLPEGRLAGRLKELGYRYPNTRAKYIAEARRHISSLKAVLRQPDPRPWLVQNVKGLGWKEASHFLRNIGFGDYAIVDFHIVDILEKHGLIKRPKSMTKDAYLEIECVLREIARRLNMTPAELDLYLWYLETGSVLK